MPARRLSLILRPYISVDLPLLIDDRDHQRAVEVLVPALADEPERCSRPRSSAPSLRFLLGRRYPSVRLAKPSWKVLDRIR